MRKLFIILAVILITQPAFAERWIQCVDVTIGSVTYEKPLRFEGDCKNIGLCTGNNNTGLLPNVFEAKGSEWNDARQSNAKCDQLASEGSRITTLTAQEIADIQAAQNAQADASIREGAKGEFDGFTSNSLIQKAVVKLVIDEINILRQTIEDMTLETNQLTDRTLPDRTISQAKTAIKNLIDSGNLDNE